MASILFLIALSFALPLSLAYIVGSGIGEENAIRDIGDNEFSKWVERGKPKPHIRVRQTKFW